MAVLAETIQKLPELAKVIHEATYLSESNHERPYIECSLAACYGDLPAQAKKLDAWMKINVGVTIKSLNKLGKNREWEKVLACMMNNPCLEPMVGPGVEVDRYATYPYNSQSWFTFGRKVDEDSPKVREAEQWIKQLIGDEDVINDLSFKPKDYAVFVNTTGAAVENVIAAIYREEKRTKTVVDIGVLRYPDMDNPYFKLYRISLNAYAKCVHTVLGDTNENGIEGQFNCRKFKPRENFIKELKDETKEKAKAVVDGLFDD